MNIEKSLNIVKNAADSDYYEYTAALHTVINELENYRAVGSIDWAEKSERLQAIIGMLPDIEDAGDDVNFATNGDMIFCRKENQADALADFLDQVCGLTCTTGYYDPEEDERNSETDNLTGWHYIDA